MGFVSYTQTMFGKHFSREFYCNRLALRSYLDKSLVENKDLHWFFILTFPNGGSTALAKLLLTSPSTIALTENAEGQWLIPSLCKKGVRWNKEYRIWKRKVRAVWLNRAMVLTKDKRIYIPTLVIEKSPPNLCRYQEILNAFKSMNTHLITFSRDPYATCASWHARYGYERIIDQWYPQRRMSVITDREYFNFLGQIWLERANMLLEARQDSICDISYEDFADNTITVLNKLGGLVPQLGNISPTAKVKVKDYGDQKIHNMNKKQIASLTAEQISAISSALCAEKSIVEKLGYSIL